MVLGIALALIGALALLNRATIRTWYDQAMGRDYVGDGQGVATFVITKGETGEKIAQGLVDAGVVKNFDIAYRLMLSRNSNYYPGTYKLRSHMSAAAALDAIANPANLQVSTVTIQEGLRIGQVLAKLSAATRIPLSNFEAAAADKVALKLPANAPSAEGFLFPATYSFPAKSTAAQILKTMVDRCYEELNRYSVSANDALKVLTLASIVQKEARQSADFYKVSRVFTNRLKVNMALQSDATVSYGSGGTTVTTTNAERANTNGYNTYVHTGLPIGPISAPGSLAIDAALHPTAGPWLYFCAVNLKTGETVFSTTVAEHEVAVAKFRAWMAANPGWNG
jgi:UPF0755 protein